MPTEKADLTPTPPHKGEWGGYAVAYEMAETLTAARKRLADAFRGAGIDGADLDARILVCAVAGIDHAGLVRDPDRRLDAAEAERLAVFAGRRLAAEPVSRILGRREFWGLSFAISSAVLDPRPETEGLVGSVLDAVGARRDDPLEILDLGTGSGAILAALLHELPKARGVAVDRSAAACRIARANFRALGLAPRTSVVCGDWGAALGQRFDVVVSNPPYIASGEIAGLAADVRDHDPAAALDGGADGLAAYRAILASLDSLLRPGGIVAFECGTGQGAALVALAEASKLVGPTVYRDLAGHDRVVLAVGAGVAGLDFALGAIRSSK